MRQYLILSLFVLTACSQEDVQQLGDKAGDFYNSSTRDNVIENWQDRVSSEPQCANFKEQFQLIGETHKSAASGAFVNDMQNIMREVKANNCALND